MGRNRRSISLGFTPEQCREGTHICYIYSNESERLQVISKYLQAGRQENEKLLYLVDVMTPQRMMDCLVELGVDARVKDGMTITEAGSTYCPKGSFTSDEMLDIVKNFYLSAVVHEGYAGARAAGEMSWFLKQGAADEEEFLAYEARLNRLLEEYPLTGCCQYDATRFSGQMIMDILSVHPAAIVRGQLIRNPYYVEPETFLREYRLRAPGRTA